jgi:DNA invertase Pin-like site-specific DNA recombinase
MLERQREGIAKAKAAGRYKGRPVSIDAALPIPELSHVPIGIGSHQEPQV